MLFLAPVTQATGQDPHPSSETRVDLSVGAGSARFTGALSLVRRHAVALNRRLWIGYGVRYSFFRGSDLRFRTADKDELNGNPTDNARIRQPAIHAVNAMAHVNVRITGRIELGFNIDVIGTGFGPEKTLEADAASDPSVPGSPAGFNLLRGGVRDRGTLNSEFFLGWQSTRRVLLRTGISHFVGEYKAESALAGGSTRLRVDGNLWFASVGYRF